MEKLFFYAVVALIVVMVLTLWVNIVTEITKKIVAWNKFPVQVWVMIVSVVSTLIVTAAATQILGVYMFWYYWIAAIGLGLIVCYAAMFGYDNLYKQIMETVKKAKEIIAGVGEIEK